MRTVRSFVRRNGKISKERQTILNNNQDVIDLNHLDDILDKEVTLEIGFGVGTSLIEMALTNPDRLFVGVEVFTNGILNVLHAIQNHKIKNLKVYQGDVNDLIAKLPENFLKKVQIFFPDPWPKKKHHKRRLIQSPFVATLISKMDENAILHLATDWEPYAEQMLEVLSKEHRLKNLATDFMPSPYERPVTKFEKKGIKAGHIIRDIVFQKNDYSRD